MHIAIDVINLLKKNNHTLSVAESCTGGGLANAISEEPGISLVFLGSLTAYANDVKISVLNISPRLIEEHGAVSEEVAKAMAKNCRELFSSSFALSTTGIAGPTGGSKEKPVGTVWVGIASSNILLAKKFIFAHVSRLEHRRKTIEQAFILLREQYENA